MREKWSKLLSNSPYRRGGGDPHVVRPAAGWEVVLVLDPVQLPATVDDLKA